MHDNLNYDFVNCEMYFSKHWIDYSSIKPELTVIQFNVTYLIKKFYESYLVVNKLSI